jgi:protein phosphatase 1 regulatory subunit 7
VKFDLPLYRSEYSLCSSASQTDTQPTTPTTTTMSVTTPLNDSLKALALADAESGPETAGSELEEYDAPDSDEEERKQAESQRQQALDHIQQTYGLTTIPDSNVESLPADDELTSDIPLDTNYIDLIHLKISSLENLRLERFPNLESINLRSNLITSLSALKRISKETKEKIEELDFYDNRIKHISSHVNEFSNITSLDLSFNNIKHIKHVDKLTRLENLYFVQNKISKIENIEPLTKLTNLEFGGNRITQIENLDTLVNLRQLWLGQNKIVKLEGLSQLRNLRVLSIQSNKISKIEGLEALESLEELYLSHNKLTQIEGLSNLKNLQVLDITGNQITHLSGLDDLTQLTDLWCSYNRIADYSNIAKACKNCKQLETVYFEGNPVQLNEPAMYRTKLRLCFGPSLAKIDALYLNK